MFGLGILKGTIIGLGIGVIASFALKEACKKSNKNNVAEESKEGPVEMEWDVNDDNNQELDDNGQIKIF